MASDAIEIHGGNGYIETWPVARLLRDAQVNTIWEGPDNILCLDVRRGIERAQAHEPLLARLHDAVSVSDDDDTTALVARRVDDLDAAITAWSKLDGAVAEARLFPLAQFMGDVYAGALLTEQAAWEQAENRTDRKALVARLYAQRYLADRGPLRGIDADGDEAIERFDELAAGRAGRSERGFGRPQAESENEPVVGVVQRRRQQLLDPAHAVAHRVRVHVQPLRHRGDVAEPVQIGGQRVGQHRILLAQFAHARIDEPLPACHMRDDLVEQHRGVRLVQRRDLADGAGVAIGAVEHAVHLGAGRRGTGQPGQRGGDHRPHRQAQLAAQRGDHAPHPRRQRRRRSDLRQQHVHPFAGRRHLRIGAKSARAQRDHVGGHRVRLRRGSRPAPHGRRRRCPARGRSRRRRRRPRRARAGPAPAPCASTARPPAAT